MHAMMIKIIHFDMKKKNRASLRGTGERNSQLWIVLIELYP